MTLDFKVQHQVAISNWFPRYSELERDGE